MGSEIRLDSRALPFLKPDTDVSCCHDPDAYLHLVDGLMGPDCPFMDNAKRPLWKLLNVQRPNTKKLPRLGIEYGDGQIASRRLFW